MKSLWIKLIFILILLGVAIWIDLPNGFNNVGIKKQPKIIKGLDLVGGVHIAYEADMKDVVVENRDAAMSSLVNVIDKRINSLGVAEPIIQSRKYGDKYGIIVELPGVKDINQAIKMIGKTALLEFKEMTEKGEWQKTNLTGRDLQKADVSSNQQTGEPVVSLKFNNEGAKKFGEITKKNLQKPLAIFLDNEMISAPTVQAEISTGEAIIEGQFSIEDAKNLSIQLNAGALPVPIKIAEQRNVGATLGNDSIQKSLLAGAIGLFLVIIFMIFLYRLPGLIASLALAFYGILIFAIFKISSITPWGITLTLAGLAGFILSVGMAVDANILIFERAKEEYREGKNIFDSYLIGFDRAWSSIRDSNSSSIITGLILFWFGTGSIRGFALVLIIGVIISMFTAITVSRTLLLLITKSRLIKYKFLFALNRKKVNK